MKGWWQSRSLRFRLALWYAVGGAALIAGFAATLYFYVAERIARPLDQPLRRDLAEVEQRLAVSADGKLSWNGRPLDARGPWTTQYPWFELWNEHNELVCRQWPFTENRVQQLPNAPTRGRETLSVFDVAPDLRLRVLSVPYKVNGSGNAEWMLRLMRVHEPAGDALGALRGIILISLPCVVGLLVLGGYFITQRWLWPLKRMANEANLITAQDLGRRLPIANPRDELGRLAAVFNVTLDRLQRSFETLDRFVADASHELRTPLTTLRSVGEVGLRRARSEVEYREIIGSMLEEAQRLQNLTGRLLELATAEGGALDVHQADVRVDQLVRHVVDELAILAETKGQRIEVTAPPTLTKTDPVLLRQALQNILENAVKYSPPDSRIDVSVEQTLEAVSVAIADDGPGISPEHESHLAQRFFRPDRARGRGSGGFGLGLSITKAYLASLGGSLRYSPRSPKGSCFTLVLPLL